MGEISLNHITKIEGHARLDLKVEDGKLVKCELGSVEGSRHFQGLLKGRDYSDAPEITSRICGICSSAHGVASVMAMEKALGIMLLYCPESIRSAVEAALFEADYRRIYFPWAS